MPNMGASSEIAQMFAAEHARLTHDSKVETFRPDDVQVAQAAEQEEQETMGTTILAATFDGGVVLASDTQTSRGSLVADYAAPKITRLTEHVWILRSGNAADTRLISKVCQKYLRNLEIQLGHPVPVRSAARLCQQIVFGNRGRLSAGLIVGGWDVEGGGQVYSILPDGATSQLDIALGGSGSTFIYAWVDDSFKRGMTQAECETFLTKAVAMAKARDGASGMNTRLTIINKDGATEVFKSWKESPFTLEGSDNWSVMQKNF